MFLVYTTLFGIIIGSIFWYTDVISVKKENLKEFVAPELEIPNREVLIALYNNVWEEITHYRNSEWKILNLVILALAAIIGLRLSQPKLFELGFVKWLSLLTIVMLWVLGTSFIIHCHVWLSENRKLRRAIESEFRAKSPVFDNALSKMILPKRISFLRGFWDFILPFSIFILLASILAVYLIFRVSGGAGSFGCMH